MQIGMPPCTLPLLAQPTPRAHSRIGAVTMLSHHSSRRVTPQDRSQVWHRGSLSLIIEHLRHTGTCSAASCTAMSWPWHLARGDMCEGEQLPGTPPPHIHSLIVSHITLTLSRARKNLLTSLHWFAGDTFPTVASTTTATPHRSPHPRCPSHTGGRCGAPAQRPYISTVGTLHRHPSRSSVGASSTPARLQRQSSGDPVPALATRDEAQNALQLELAPTSWGSQDQYIG